MAERHPTLPNTTEPVYLHYKEPLKPIENGYGYYGTLATDPGQTHVQCHICGNFFYHLGAHVRFKHGMKASEYKEQFGLYMRQSLLAQKTREEYIKRSASNDKWTREQMIEHLRSIRKRKAEMIKNGEIQTSRRGIVASPAERKNIEGRCVDQLRMKIVDITRADGIPPTSRDFKKWYGHGYYSSILATFGTWNNALEAAGLAKRSQGNMAYTDEEILQAVMRFQEIHDRQVSYSDFDNEDMLPSKRVIQRFGGIKKLRERVAV